jgi:class 3 adenylate cyclase
VALHVRVDRPRCIGAGNCISVAPTAFDWLEGDFAKAAVVDVESVDAEVLRAAAYACPTQAIEIEEVGELLPLQSARRDAATVQRVEKTFLFTDIVGSTSLAEALGDEAWEGLLRWHDEALRALFTVHHGQEVVTTGDGFFVGFDSPEDAIGCAVAIQKRLDQQRREHGFAPQVRIGVHYASAQQVQGNYRGKGVHEAARIAAVATGSEILVSRATAEGTGFRLSEPRTVALKGLSEPMDVVSVTWR